MHPNKHPNIMLDLETLGTRPGCAILSIGAIAFDAKSGLREPFYLVVNTKSCLAKGLTVDANTLAWHRGRGEEHAKILAEAEASKVGIGGAIATFADYLRRIGHPKQISIWGNGADFDPVILAHCYAILGLPLPWEFWNTRCFRTLRALAELPKRTIVKHNALEDATDQAAEAVEILKRLKMEPKEEAPAPLL